MMEAVRTSETSADNYFTRQYIPEDNSEHQTRRHENLKSHIIMTKLKIIKHTKRGESLALIKSSTDLSRWLSVYSIVKEKDKIKNHKQNAGNMQTMIMSKRQGAVTEEMEKSLKLWIEDQH
jgi:hypothetical protein